MTVITLPDNQTHQHWMGHALKQASIAADHQEVPVGAVVVQHNRIIATGFNQPITACDPCAHAEIVALRQAAKNSGNYRLPGCTLYVTIEPCMMCIGAIIHARIEQLIFGAREPRAGAVISQIKLSEMSHFNHQLNWQEGVLAEECAQLMRSFFKNRR